MFSEQELNRLANFEVITEKFPWISKDGVDEFYKKMISKIKDSCDLNAAVNLHDINYMATYIDVFFYLKDGSLKETGKPEDNTRSGIILLLSRLGNFYTLAEIERFGFNMMSGGTPHPYMKDNFDIPTFIKAAADIRDIAKEHGLIELKMSDLRLEVDEALVSDLIKSDVRQGPYTEFNFLYYTDYSI